METAISNGHAPPVDEFVAAADDYHRRGLVPLPLYDDKNPGFTGWPKYTYTEQSFRAPNHGRIAKGVGVLVGPRSRIIDFEYDTPAQREKAIEVLGGLIEGPRYKTKHGEHWWFAWDDRLSACGNRARQLFAAAVKHQLIESNPFGSMTNLKALEVRGRSRFISRETIDKVLEQIVDPELKLIIVLSRYGGLRVPSEPLAMKWGDVDWARERITVHSVKTERHDGKQTRVIPMFPEIKPHLEAVYHAAPEGTEDVIIRHREAATTLWRRLGVAVRAAGLDEWPKPFHNLRATRETELMDEGYPPQTVCKWIGHDITVPAKHYLQVTDEHYARALQKCVQQPAATGCNSGK